MVKQADVILLGFPLLFEMPANVRANDLIYYANYTTTDGPAMTWAMFAMGWLDLANYTQADKLFAQGYANIQAPFNVWQETPTGGTVNFITGAGGFLQSVLFGYSGLRLRDADQGLTLVPPPNPGNATLVRIHSLHYQGSTLSIDVTNDTLTVLLLTEGSTPLVLLPENEEAKPLVVGVPVAIASGPASILPASSA